MARALRRSWGARILMAIAWFLGLIGTVALAAALYIYLPGGKDRLESRFTVPAYSPVDFDTMRKDGKPPSFLVAPAGLGVEKADLVAPEFPLPASQVAALWREQVAVGENVTERKWDPATNTAYSVERTQLMRYPDLITARFIDLGDGRSTVALFSTSVYGLRDAGVNERRVRDWLERLTKAAQTG